jgi:Rrf2 family protein
VKLTVRGEYALRALTNLGRRYGPHVVRIQEIADEEGIPKRFLEQILNDLRTGGFVESRRGVAGGYRLAKSPERIPLAAVVRHIEGALAPIGCVSENFYEKCNCPDEARCALRSVMKEVRDNVANLMQKLTVAELVQRSHQLQAEPTTSADYFI